MPAESGSKTIHNFLSSFVYMQTELKCNLFAQDNNKR